MAVSGSGDRLFVADNNVMATDVTQYEIGAGLTLGAVFSVGPYTRGLAPHPTDPWLIASYTQAGGGVVVAELGAPDALPTLSEYDDRDAWAGVNDVAFMNNEDCVFISADLGGLSGDVLQSFSFADGTLTPVNSVQTSGTPKVSPHDDFVLGIRSSALGSVDVITIEDGCLLGEITDSRDAPAGIHSYSPLARFGIDATVLEFNASGAARRLIIEDGQILEGAELSIPNGARSAVLLPVAE